MKYFWITLLVSPLIAQGGYVSLSYEFNLKSKEKGYQISFGIALPGIGESGNGPFVFRELHLEIGAYKTINRLSIQTFKQLLYLKVSGVEQDTDLQELMVKK